MQGLSEKLRKIINKNNKNTQLTFKNKKTIHNLFTKTKDPTPPQMQSNLVYKIPCSSCPSVYIGNTAQYLKKRLYQHSYDCNKNSQNDHNSALVQHHLDTTHKFDFKAATIIDKETNTHKRNLLESIHILQHEHSVNIKSETTCLHNSYSQLIKKKRT